MTAAPTSRRLLRGSAFAALACLSACAAEPKPPPPAAAPAAVSAPAPVVTMAPIANPEAAQPAHHEAAPARSRGEGAARHAPTGHAATASPPPASPAPAGADPAEAAKLRARGLEELNRGAVAKAVALLSQASRLDPGNALIRRDLERAERINRAVHAPH